MGRLAYVSHDNEREKPVYFKWQILDWEIPQNKLNEMNLILENIDYKDKKDKVKDELIKSKPPISSYNKKDFGKTTSDFKGIHVDYTEENFKRKNLGLQGE